MPRARIKANYLVTGPSILDDGAVLIEEDGTVAAAGPVAEVPAPPGCPEYDYGEAVILPGLTNAHTHLELTGLNGGEALVEPHFPTWIRRLRELKAGRTYGDFLAAARDGIRQCFRQGVTTIADTGDSGAVPEAMAELGMRGVYYHEVFGPDPVLVRESMNGLASAMDSLQRWQSRRVTIGVSPHAPYTVSGPLYREVCRWARERGLPIAVHIAESADESALLATASGAFADAWRRRSLPMPEPLGLTPVSYLAHWNVWSEECFETPDGAAEVLAIHAVNVPPDDLHVLKATGAMVAWCPLANRAHGHGEAPVEEIQDTRIPLGLGTDSELSVGPIDLLEVARLAAEFVGPSMACGLMAFGAGDLAGARKGSDLHAGDLLPGTDADLAIFPCSPDMYPMAAPLQPDCNEALATWAAGRLVHQGVGSLSS